MRSPETVKLIMAGLHVITCILELRQNLEMLASDILTNNTGLAEFTAFLRAHHFAEQGLAIRALR